ncbi:MAG: bifunctional UDP-N-acetylglucosamine diphosphorylase/glucosamine-1-phosphate N-acetyltransferase GlmU [Proteobacteria bacterium]|nr:bifunctional UDP-N-acetylglucosamine diphosphorylase/glucosamine-1-phosphate N-acetyltransferase GlmU [Pseudomonadota bacterium]
MKKPDIAVIVLAAGLGTRMKSDRPKVLHKIAGRSIIGHVMAAIAPLAPSRVALIVGPEMDDVAAAAGAATKDLRITPVVQRERKGTGHAALQAQKALAGFVGEVLILTGDTPLMTTAMLERLVAARSGPEAPAVIDVGMRVPDPNPYGRMVVGADNGLERIVEMRDATPQERKIDLCNSGVFAVDSRHLFDLLGQVRPDNAKNEYYLTDIVGLARRAGLACGYIEAPHEEFIGINSRAELAMAEGFMQARLRLAAMAAGATLTDPSTVWLSHDTKLGPDATVGPSVIFGPGVEVAGGVEILGFCHIEGASIAKGARIGPFARLRPGAEIGENAHVGNFVEIKNARVEAGAKVNHLAYIGDARVGARANVGAGTITCNYDGFVKAFTDIGEGAFIGSNSALVAPVKIGAGAIVAAGAVITRDVPPDALAVARGRQEDKSGWAKTFRAKRAAEKAKTAKRSHKD